MTCTKIPYESLSSAHAALSALKRKREGSGRTECAIHPCTEHHAFHITSDKRSARNRWTRTRRA